MHRNLSILLHLDHTLLKCVSYPSYDVPLIIYQVSVLQTNSQKTQKQIVWSLNIDHFRCQCLSWRLRWTIKLNKNSVLCIVHYGMQDAEYSIMTEVLDTSIPLLLYQIRINSHHPLNVCNFTHIDKLWCVMLPTMWEQKVWAEQGVRSTPCLTSPRPTRPIVRVQLPPPQGESVIINIPT